MKAATSDGRFALDITGFLLDWDDVQLLAVINGIGLNANGGTAKSKGFEFSASAAPVEGLTLSLNGAYTDAYLTEDTDPIVGGLDGDPLSFVPEWSFGVDGDDRRLQRVRPGRAPGGHRELGERDAFGDQRAVPLPPVLFLERDERAAVGRARLRRPVARGRGAGARRR